MISIAKGAKTSIDGRTDEAKDSDGVIHVTARHGEFRREKEKDSSEDSES